MLWQNNIIEVENIREGFGSLADSYDEDEKRNDIIRWMRRVVWESYLQNFEAGNEILELNCGTGIDALFLAQHGIKVMATDISPQMLQHVKDKIQKYHFENLISTRELALQEIDQLRDTVFDGMISNFGGFNCVSDLSSIIPSLARLIKPGGACVICLMTNFCLFETFSFLVKGNFRLAFRRARNQGTDANLGGYHIHTFYYSPKTFARQFFPFFEVKQIYGLGIFVPPPHALHSYRKYKRFFETAAKLERVIAHKYPFYNIGDHFVVELRRRTP